MHGESLVWFQYLKRRDGEPRALVTLSPPEKEAALRFNCFNDSSPDGMSLEGAPLEG